MGIFTQLGRFAKYAAVSMPLQVLGLNQLKRNSFYVGTLWRSVRNPVCPNCECGLLMRSDGMIDSEGFPNIVDQRENGRDEMLYAWTCDNSRCGFKLLGEASARKIAPRVARHRNEHAKRRLADMPNPEVMRLVSNHRTASRFYFVSSAFIFAGFIHKLATGSNLSISFSWAAVAVVLWLFGMKKSYHAWLVMTSSLFRKDAFLFWFQHEKWFI